MPTQSPLINTSYPSMPSAWRLYVKAALLLDIRPSTSSMCGRHFALLSLLVLLLQHP